MRKKLKISIANEGDYIFDTKKNKYLKFKSNQIQSDSPTHWTQTFHLVTHRKLKKWLKTIGPNKQVSQTVNAKVGSFHVYKYYF